MTRLPQALTIATSDSGGGAGIQADIKAIQANGVFALSVLVAVTAQNTRTVTNVHPLPADIIESQIDAVFDDFEIGAVKTGMLFSEEIVGLVSKKLRSLPIGHLVVDPVMISKGGAELLKPDAVEKMKRDLFPLATVVTPNIHESERLAGMPIKTIDDARQAAARIHGFGCRAVLVKGGHLESNPATDVLYDGDDYIAIPGEWIETQNTHGTGCTYSAAITAQLAKGKPLKESVLAAKRYITEAIRNGLSIGHGHGPTHHFYFLKGDPP
jgi:hydroxymethylpyrimidine/phosphomethylpyrimidine kinase